MTHYGIQVFKLDEDGIIDPDWIIQITSASFDPVIIDAEIHTHLSATGSGVEKLGRVLQNAAYMLDNLHSAGIE